MSGAAGGALRLAEESDLAAIERVMKASTAALSRGFYTEEQIASAVTYIAVPDRQLIDDRTYFVIDQESLPDSNARSLPTAGSRIVACGGWSARRKLFTGTAEQAAADGWLDPSTDAARIRAMFVDPAFSRRGLGRAILQAAEEGARAAGFRTIELMATLPGVPLYASCGYEPVREAVLALPDGARLGAVLMRRRVH